MCSIFLHDGLKVKLLWLATTIHICFDLYRTELTRSIFMAPL